MALKAKVYEKCPRCGLQAAVHEGDQIREWHRCPEAPPGPSDPPRTHHPDRVVWVPGDWTETELRAMLDAANQDRAELRRVAVDRMHRLRQVREMAGDE